MALSPAKRKSNDKWIKENYKQVKLSMPNEEVEALDNHCTTYQYTKAGFIRQAIQEKIAQDVSAADTPPPKKERLPNKGKTMVVIQTDDELTEDVPALLKTIRDSQKVTSKNTLPQKVAEKIITDKMDSLRAENRMGEYNALINLLAITPECKADFMQGVKNANFMSDVDEAITALVIFHGLRDGE